MGLQVVNQFFYRVQDLHLQSTGVRDQHVVR